MTRVLCLVLCLATLAMGFVGCSSGDSTSGAQINMYLTSEVYNFDPAYAHLDSSAIKLCGLLYEGLMKLDDNGKVVKALCKKWSYKVDKGTDKESTEDDTYTMEITIRTSAWSDGSAVTADDFVFAWKRLLDPEFDGEGAELLYDIKGARERKTEAYSPDDIGLVADQQLLTIEFTHDIDPEDFLRKLTSVALMPVKQSVVDHYNHWASSSTTLVTNGQFTVLSYYPGSSMELGRNTYYHFDVSDKDATPNPSKYVKPYKIIVDFQLNAEEIMEQFEEGELFYISELPASKEIREKYLDKVKLTESLCSHVYYFNTNKAPFDNKVVRQVLSAVISRSEIVNEVVYASASTGVVPSGVNDKTDKDDFAANNASKITTDAMSISEAKSLLKAAGITPSTVPEFTLTVRVNADSEVDETSGKITIAPVRANSASYVYNTVDYVVAKLVQEKWEELGFKCKIECLNAENYKEKTSWLTQYRDGIVETLYGTNGEIEYVDDNESTSSFSAERADFDVIAVDSQMLDTTAFSALSVFATEYSGSSCDFIVDENNHQTISVRGHVTGYNSEAYNKLIAEADEARIKGDTETLSAKLHEAEQLLLEDMPIMPIFVYKNATLASKELSKYDVTGWGAPVFNKLKLKNWQDHLPNSDEDDD